MSDQQHLDVEWDAPQIREWFIELPTQEQARRGVMESLALARLIDCTDAAAVRETFEWGQMIFIMGWPVPPLGFVADIGQSVFDRSWDALDAVSPSACWPPSLRQQYEEFWLRRLWTDRGFQRAAAFLRRLSPDERKRGIAFLSSYLAFRLRMRRLLFVPYVLTQMLQPSELSQALQQARDWLQQPQFMNELHATYAHAMQAARSLPELIAPTILAAIEDRSALSDMLTLAATRELRRAVSRLLDRIPAASPRTKPEAPDLLSPLRTEASYPTGGYGEITTRGTWESLLWSQLAFMEQQQPDLFDIKWLRGELYYYSRDENYLWRQRRMYVFVLAPDLMTARFKDRHTPHQRMILVLAIVAAIIQRLLDWLAGDRLQFRIIWPGTPDNPQPLANEQNWLQVLLRPLCEQGIVQCEAWPQWEPGRIRDLSRDWPVYGVMMTIAETAPLPPEGAWWIFQLKGKQPLLKDRHGVMRGGETDDTADPLSPWASVLDQLLQAWW